jgi:hypothetical protein
MVDQRQTVSKAGHPLSNLARCLHFPSPAVFCARVKVVGYWPMKIAEFVKVAAVQGEGEKELLFALRVEDDSACSDVVLHGKYACQWLASQGVANATAATVSDDEALRREIKAMLEVLITGGSNASTSSGGGGIASSSSSSGVDGGGVEVVVASSSGSNAKSNLPSSNTTNTITTTSNNNKRIIELYLRSHLSTEERVEGRKKKKTESKTVRRLQVFDGEFPLSL